MYAARGAKASRHHELGPGERGIVQDGIPDAIPPEACYLGWQESLRNLARLVEPEINQQRTGKSRLAAVGDTASFDPHAEGV